MAMVTYWLSLSQAEQKATRDRDMTNAEQETSSLESTFLQKSYSPAMPEDRPRKVEAIIFILYIDSNSVSRMFSLLPQF